MARRKQSARRPEKNATTRAGAANKATRTEKENAITRTEAGNKAARTQGRSRKAMVERQKKKKRRRLLSRICLCVLVVLAVIFAPTVFFQVSTIEVTGETRYTSEELIAASGVTQGDNLSFLDKKGITSGLAEQFPYLDTVKVHRKLPSTIQIEVSDRTAALSVEQSGKYLLMDLTGKALESVDAAAKDTVEVVGAKTSLQPGDAVDAADGSRMSAVLKLMDFMGQYDLQDHIKKIDVSKAYDVRVQYEDRYTVLLGTIEEDNMEHKVQFLKAILGEESLPDSGIIDLTDDEVARYRPEEDTTDYTVVLSEEDLQTAIAGTRDNGENADGTDGTEGTENTDGTDGTEQSDGAANTDGTGDAENAAESTDQSGADTQTGQDAQPAESTDGTE